MVGNFLAACNEHEAAEKLVVEGGASPPEPRLVLAMNTNRGIRCARQNALTRTILKGSSAIRLVVNESIEIVHVCDLRIELCPP